MGSVFRKGLAWLQAKHPRVLVEVRQRGLMMGLKLAHESLGPLLTLLGFRYGVLTIYANHDPSVNQLLPPLTIEKEQVQELLEALDRMLGQLESQV
jgi:acetylornithine/succinyldiaminopimelate/putrescine aminotransferase